MRQHNKLETAIANLESQRAILGDETVDAAIAALRAQLAQTVPSPHPENQVQRKQATVLFADVSGFTALSETMDAEDVRETMNALWRRVDRAILDFNGRIDKHIGDAVMAFWGSNEAQEDDPEQAIRAALAMQNAVSSFAATHQLPLKMRVGINTGPVLLGEVGTTSEYTAMGDTVNMASRLEHAAPVGGILISRDTYRHVRGIFDVESQPPLLVKGKSEPLQTYVVQQAKPRAFRLRTRGVEGVETQTIGRDKEMVQLKDAYNSAVQNRKTTVVSLVGDAGIGKTRLLYEFEKWLELRPEPIWYFKGRASAQTQGIPQFLLRDLFAARFQIFDSDSLAVVRQKFVAGFNKIARDASPDKAPVLGTWLGYDFSHDQSPHLRLDDPEQLKNRATLYLAQFFGAAARRQPVVLFLEDIHWADNGSLDALIDLVRRRPDLPMLVVCLARPLLDERRPDWGAMIPKHSRFTLTPLSKEDTTRMVSEILHLLKTPPPILIDLISARAEGNPFYAEELVKMLIDDGAIVTGPEAWQVVSDKLLELKVPSTLTGVLQSRLDKLGGLEKRTLQQASVIGRVFWDKALAALQAQTPQALPYLEAKEFIFAQLDSAFAETTEYVFKHSLLRDVTYETVLKRMRRRYHALVATWLENAAAVNDRSDEMAALIGDHYHLAENDAAAAVWYGRVGLQAAATFAHDEALRYLERALKYAPSEEAQTQFNLLLAHEKALDYLGNREAQRNDLEQLVRLAKRLTPQEEAIVAQRQAHYADVTSNYARAILHAQRVISLAQQVRDVALEAAGYAAWGNALWQQDNYPLAKEKFQASMQLARQINDLKQESYCLHGLGIVSDLQGNFSDARLYYEQALAIRREIGDRHGEGATLNGLGIISGIQGDHATARKHFEQALAISHEIGNRYREGACLNNLGFGAINQGDYKTAKGYFEKSLAIWREIDDRYREGTSLINLGVVAGHQDDFATANALLERSLRISREIGNRWAEGTTLYELGNVALLEGKYETAASYYKSALALHEELNQHHYRAEDWAGLARVMLAQNDLENAKKYALNVFGTLKEKAQNSGAASPMRTLHYTWDVLLAVGETEAADVVLAQAADAMQAYLDVNTDPELRTLYLSQRHHEPLWAAWSRRNAASGQSSHTAV